MTNNKRLSYHDRMMYELKQKQQMYPFGIKPTKMTSRRTGSRRLFTPFEVTPQNALNMIANDTKSTRNYSKYKPIARTRNTQHYINERNRHKHKQSIASKMATKSESRRLINIISRLHIKQSLKDPLLKHLRK